MQRRKGYVPQPHDSVDGLSFLLIITEDSGSILGPQPANSATIVGGFP